MNPRAVRHTLFALAALLVATGLPAGAARDEAPVGAQAYVTVEPEGATVACDGKVIGAPPLALPGLAPGEHLIVVSKLGFEEVRRTVNVEEGQRVNVEVRLSPITGLVLVQTAPAGATVEVGGAYRGETPLLITDLPLGNHRVRLSMADRVTRMP